MSIFLIGSTLRLDGHLTRKDCDFLKMALKETMIFRQKVIRVEMAGLRSADAEILTILSAGCFFLRLTGPGAILVGMPDWLPEEFKSTVPFWATSEGLPLPRQPNGHSLPLRLVSGDR